MKDDIRTEVRRLRFLNGEMTQEDLAARVGVSRQTIIAIEKGKYNPSVGLALRIARAFGVRVEDVFALADEAPLEASHDHQARDDEIG
ncbi:MAG: helix-turn-helix transcriptional regulator [bacterium]|nr:helix-turn-helix transcriptional regulator [bacterium]MBK7702593.1 helix-turn-helix transcriptional regulator [bacterium]MBK9303912.1 helix-turn-helix transcriptional regulator [bacterium]